MTLKRENLKNIKGLTKVVTVITSEKSSVLTELQDFHTLQLRKVCLIIERLG